MVNKTQCQKTKQNTAAHLSMSINIKVFTTVRCVSCFHSHFVGWLLLLFFSFVLLSRSFQLILSHLFLFMHKIISIDVNRLKHSIKIAKANHHFKDVRYRFASSSSSSHCSRIEISECFFSLVFSRLLWFFFFFFFYTNQITTTCTCTWKLWLNWRHIVNFELFLKHKRDAT